jgi:hypothetical protein
MTPSILSLIILQTKRAVEEALGMDIASAFISFERKPLASASVAQVPSHRIMQGLIKAAMLSIAEIHILL